MVYLHSDTQPTSIVHRVKIVKTMQQFLCHLLLVQLLIAWSISVSSGQFASGPLPQSYDAPGACTAGSEFYNTANLSCVACATNKRTSSDGERGIFIRNYSHYLGVKEIISVFLLLWTLVEFLNKAHPLLPLHSRFLLLLPLRLLSSPGEQ